MLVEEEERFIIFLLTLSAPRKKKGVDVRPSNDAGRYLCDFIYYTSLVEYWRRDPDVKAPAMFLHVPGRIEDMDIETGRKVALGLIGAMVGSARRKKEEKEGVGGLI